MKTQLNNIIELAAQLIVDGIADEETAILKAIEMDNKRILGCTNAINNMRRGFINEHDKTQKAFGIIMNSVYKKLS